MTSGTPLLTAAGLGKSFPGVRALHQVGLTASPGEIVAVIGENGAGKSTLMKILAGVQEPDQGSLHWNGRGVRIPSVRAALALGIALIHQELNLADNLDVASNVFLGREPQRCGFIDRRALRDQAVTVLNRVGLAVAPDTIVSTLSTGQQQMVEIAKALSVDARLLIMDEPTSSLSAGETQRLFQVVKELRHQGMSVLYVSHRLGEVKELADRVIVLRDGKFAGELAGDAITHESMVRLMVGRDVSKFYVRSPHEPGEEIMQVRDLRTARWPEHPISLSVRAGEIVGIAGLVGAGRTELAQTLFGVTPPVSGSVHVRGRPLLAHSPSDAIADGLALVPEDRKTQGLVLEMSVNDNMTLATVGRTATLGFRNRRQEARCAESMISTLGVKVPHGDTQAGVLSGGNQQKVVLGKWLATEPRVLILDEPTRGIDIGAKAEIYALLDRLARQGAAILFVSSEMEEILGISDRVLVMHQGRLVGEIAREQLSERAVMAMATGADEVAA